MSERFFAYFAGVVLTTTAILKIISGVTHPEFAHERDVVFSFLSVKHVLGTGALLELLVAWMCMSSKVPRYRAWLSLFWLSTCFLFYRLGPLIVIGQAKLACKCLGELSLASGQAVLDGVLLGLLGLLLLRSLFFALREAKATQSCSDAVA